MAAGAAPWQGRSAVTIKVVLTVALVVFLAGPQILALVRAIRDTVRARVRVGQQAIVYREDGVRLRSTSAAWWSFALGWTTVDVVVGRRDAYLFTRPFLGVVPRSVHRLVRDATERDPSAPGIALDVTAVETEKGRVVIRASGPGRARRVLRIASRTPETLARALAS